MFKTILRFSALAIAASSTLALPAFAQSADWQRQVARVIAAKQTYPRTAQMRGEEGTARVKVFIGANGAIEHAEIVGPSGSSTLDREALSLLSRVATVPPPPGGPAAITVPITWKLY